MIRPGAAYLTPLLALLLGCAARTDARTRQAFVGAKAPGDGEPGGPDAPGAADAAGADRTAVGWPRIAAMIQLASGELATGEPARVEALLQRWCAVEPSPQQTDAGTAYVCVPEPPLVVAGHAWSLELSPDRGGLVSLVSPSLSGAAAQDLAQTARAAVADLCATPMAPIRDLASPHQEVHTCPVRGGTQLAVARLPRDLPADLWQVSLTLLGAT